MPQDIMQPIKDAEAEIAARTAKRANVSVEIRTAASAEQVADELTRIRGELKVLRGLFANFAALKRLNG